MTHLNARLFTEASPPPRCLSVRQCASSSRRCTWNRKAAKPPIVHPELSPINLSFGEILLQEIGIYIESQARTGWDFKMAVLQFERCRGHAINVVVMFAELTFGTVEVLNGCAEVCVCASQDQRSYIVQCPPGPRAQYLCHSRSEYWPCSNA
jgi:hypothetical protein